MALLDYVSVYSYVGLLAVAGFVAFPDPTGIVPTLVTLTGVVVAGSAALLSDPTRERLAGAVGTTVLLFALLWVLAVVLGASGPLARPVLVGGALLAVPAGYLLSPLAVGGLRASGVGGAS
jgi:sorbitol-specific phosphotransferase system component IIC